MGKLIDLTNKKFNRLEVIQRGPNTKAGQARWFCKCDCGETVLVAGADLRSGHTKSCGCLKIEAVKSNAASLEGKRFGKLLVVGRNLDRNDFQKAWWSCLCDCGNESCVPTGALTTGNSTSCGLCVGTVSIGEKNIEDILKENGIQYKRQVGFDDLPLKKFDFAIINDKNEIIRLIEFDGKQHYGEGSTNWYSEDIVRRDREKDDYARKNNIELVRIRYEYRDRMNLEMLMGDKFLVKGR